VTDASGEDGIGGYAFHPGTPGVVWLMADAWPDDVLAALAHAAVPRAERTSNRGVAACSMPLSELFGPWAMAAAVTDGLDTDGGRRHLCHGLHPPQRRLRGRGHEDAPQRRPCCQEFRKIAKRP